MQAEHTESSAACQLLLFCLTLFQHFKITFTPFPNVQILVGQYFIYECHYISRWQKDIFYL